MDRLDKLHRRCIPVSKQFQRAIQVTEPQCYCGWFRIVTAHLDFLGQRATDPLCQWYCDRHASVGTQRDALSISIGIKIWYAERNIDGCADAQFHDTGSTASCAKECNGRQSRDAGVDARRVGKQQRAH